MSTLRSLSLGIGAVVCVGAASLLSPATDATAAGRVTAAATDFEQAPPAVDAIHITSRGQQTGGNALLALTYSKDQDLPTQIPFNVGDTTVQLQQDPSNPQRYTALIPFDFDGFVREQENRQILAQSQELVPEFSGRELIGQATVQFLDPTTLRAQILAGTPILVPGPVLPWPAALVRPERSLMVTHPGVVEDPSRTFDACTGAGNPNGAWTFNRMMTNMANQPMTGVLPADFVENWMRTWGTSTSINTFPVNLRSQVITQVLNTWPRIASTGKLDLNRSPFRLLAIVNRIDMRGNSAYGGGNAGETRFVFGVLRRSGTTCVAAPFTVILEYAPNVNGCPAVRNLANQWGNLGTLSLGSATYNAALQAITDPVIAANASPRKPNGSAINQIRSNEFLQNPWELREFKILQGSPQLRIVPAAQTPHHSHNNTALLANYINTFNTQILNNTYIVPLSYLGTPFQSGSVINPSPQQVWKAPGILNNNGRNKFSVNTCDACHGAETQTTSFLHVAPRSPGVQSVLSRFLIGNGSLAAPTTFTMPDPVSGTPRTYGDLQRRQTDLATLQSSTCLSGSLFHEATRAVLTASH